MLRAMITPLTLYQVLKQRDPEEDLFEDLELPVRPFTDRGYEDLYLTGWDIDKDTLVNNLLMETAELNTIYTDPDFLKWAIGQWSSKELSVWQELYETLFYRYNPIWNKDGTRKHSDTETRDLATGLTESGTTGSTVTDATTESKTRTVDETIERDETSTRAITTTMDGDVTDTETPAAVETQTVTHNTSTDTETKVAAYNSSTYEARDKSEVDNTGTDTTVTGKTGTNTKVTDYDTTETVNDNLTAHDDETTRDYDETEAVAGNRTQTTSGTSGSTRSGTDTGTVEHVVEETETGNIGVTMSQALIESQRALVQFNIYDYIIESFKRRFCVLVY